MADSETLTNFICERQSLWDFRTKQKENTTPNRDLSRKLWNGTALEMEGASK
jgi:hypothetical protein